MKALTVVEPMMWEGASSAREIGAQAVMDVVWATRSRSTIRDSPAAQKIQDLADRSVVRNGFRGIDVTAARIRFFCGKTGDGIRLTRRCC